MFVVSEVRADRGDRWYESEAPSNDMTLVAVSYGRCVYWLGAEQEKVILDKGELLLIPAGALFYGKGVPTNVHEKYVVRFSVAPAQEPYSLPVLGTARWVKSKVGAFDLVLERLKALHTELQDRIPHADAMAGALLLELLVIWNRELDRGPVASDVIRNVERMKQYILDHYREKVTKQELGEHIGKSPNHAATLFRRVTGQTISEYLHHARIRTAKYMLNESLLTLSEISDFVGYSDLSYFQRMFKRIAGHPPSFFRSARR
ncbi:helix-turn-helix transcriptional regulator [Paenibacillus antri]|uniref:Helix-turn-helix transcriptional regulator n=1 Tax=Paenibacillus antri TaxID=2582848 RepID=A0A5R9G7P0_9BACL|nr:AraC family transcriptional regulator [Paenibacillus antri]TLS52437.1 helix-turn-helix transcriptional regulator [Paenibacillus antri]